MCNEVQAGESSASEVAPNDAGRNDGCNEAGCNDVGRNDGGPNDTAPCAAALEEASAPRVPKPRPSARVLVVDDDARLRAMLVEYLTRNGFEVTSAGTCSAAAAKLARDAFEVIVLDLALPDGSGLDLCGELRARGVHVGVVMLSARGDDFDRVTGLDIGADDYLAKPCNPRELLARVHAVLRRTAAPEVSTTHAQMKPLRFGRCALDITSRLLVRDCEVVAHLTAAEFAVLFALVSRPGQTLSRERLARLARGRGIGLNDRSIDMQIARLRKLVETEPARPRYLRTVRGAGYSFVAGGAALLDAAVPAGRMPPTGIPPPDEAAPGDVARPDFSPSDATVP